MTFQGIEYLGTSLVPCSTSKARSGGNGAQLLRSDRLEDSLRRPDDQPVKIILRGNALTRLLSKKYLSYSSKYDLFSTLLKKMTFKFRLAIFCHILGSIVPWQEILVDWWSPWQQETRTSRGSSADMPSLSPNPPKWVLCEAPVGKKINESSWQKIDMNFIAPLFMKGWRRETARTT